MKYLLILFLLFPTFCFAESKQTVKIQVLFSEDVDIKGTTINYSDALYYSPEVYASLKQEDIDKVKAERINNFIEIVKNPTIQKEPTKEELILQIAQIEEQKQSLEAQKIEIQDKITALDAVPIEEVIPE